MAVTTFPTQTADLIPCPLWIHYDGATSGPYIIPNASKILIVECTHVSNIQ